MTPEIEALKARLKAIWMAGDYGHFAHYLEPGAMEFFPCLHIAPGERVLDVACGAGQLALPAARAGATVTGVDIATNLIEQARSRAKAEGLEIRSRRAHRHGELDAGWLRRADVQDARQACSAAGRHACRPLCCGATRPRCVIVLTRGLPTFG